MDSQIKEKIKEVISELLGRMDFSSRVEIDDSQPEFLTVRIESEEAGLLIGQGGENLSALQHLARAVVNKKMVGEHINFIIDVNNYRANRLGLLKELALNLAKEAQRDRLVKALEPMSSYERRIIHLAIKDLPGVETESQGEGDQRHIVIKPTEKSEATAADNPSF